MQRKQSAEEAADFAAQTAAGQAIAAEIAAEKALQKEIAKKKALRRQQAVDRAVRSSVSAGNLPDLVDRVEDDDDDSSMDSGEREMINQTTELVTMRDVEVQQRLGEQRRQETLRMEHEDINSYVRETYDKREALWKVQRRQELEDFYRPPDAPGPLTAMGKNGFRAVLPDLIFRPMSGPGGGGGGGGRGGGLSPRRKTMREMVQERPKNQFT